MMKRSLASWSGSIPFYPLGFRTMNTSSFCKVSFLWCAAALLALRAFAGELSDNTRPALKVQVNIPPHILAHERLPEYLAASISDALVQQGFVLPVVPLRTVEDAGKAPILLTIDVADWRMTKEGDVACSFAARIRTPNGERELGVFSDTRWVPGVIYPNSSRAYFPARADAIRALGRELENSGLLPELAQAGNRFRPPPALASTG
jgi:hypothetical protein